ncbi:MAG: flagellar basal-body rod protein FlgG [Burkholderiales bacterium]|nr:flagellar basal-body rod protein FlgG [Burkholderiales bacterium]
MLDSLYIAATGMAAQQLNVDTISNNLANVNTTAFKRNRISFADLMYRSVAQGNRPLGSGAANFFGVGVGVTATGKIQTPGEVKKTDQPLDLALRGKGLFEVTLPDNSLAYTRGGSLQLDKDGLLTTAEGFALNPAVRIPADATAVTIESNGRVLAKVPDEKDPIEVGTITLVDFINPAALRPLGDNLYLPTEKSGDPISGKAGEQGLGLIAQGFLEASNVQLVDEFVNLIVAQRAYEASSKAIQASDEMLGLSNNLRR